MGNIRNFKGVRSAVLNFDYYWSKGRFLCYKILQIGGEDSVSLYSDSKVQRVL